MCSCTDSCADSGTDSWTDSSADLPVSAPTSCGQSHHQQGSPLKVTNTRMKQLMTLVCGHGPEPPASGRQKRTPSETLVLMLSLHSRHQDLLRSGQRPSPTSSSRRVRRHPATPSLVVAVAGAAAENAQELWLPAQVAAAAAATSWYTRRTRRFAQGTDQLQDPFPGNS